MATVRLAPDRLGEALDAVLGNVFAHTPEGVAVTVAVTRGDGAVTVVVEDDGPGWPPDLAVGERGTTGSARSTGLGLDIARRVAEEAGGRLVLEAGDAGGARVVLRLPTA